MIFQHHNLVKRLSVLKNVLVGRMADLSPCSRRCSSFPEADVEIALQCLERSSSPQGEAARRHAVGRRAAARRHRPRAGAAAQVHAGRRAGREPRPEDLAHRAHVPQAELQGAPTSPCSATCTRSTTRVEFGERIVGLSAGEVVFDGPPVGVYRARCIRSIYPGLDDPDIARCRAAPDRRRRAAAEAVIAAAASTRGPDHVIGPAIRRHQAARAASVGGSSVPHPRRRRRGPVVVGARHAAQRRPNSSTACRGSAISSAACCRRTSPSCSKLVRAGDRDGADRALGHLARRRAGAADLLLRRPQPVAERAASSTRCARC